MKILLIYPMIRLALETKPTMGYYWLPLGLSFIAAALREAGHQVAVFDRLAMAARLGSCTKRIDVAMLEQMRAFKPDMVGLNTVSPLIYDTAHCAALIRPQFEGLLVAGGHHTTALPELTLQRIPELDGTIQGEGERVLCRLANGEHPATLPGVWWRNQGPPLGRPPEQIRDLDRLPFPALDLMDTCFYTHPAKYIGRGSYLATISMLTSRGCTRHCDFCTESLTYGSGVRLHSPEYILAWLQEILVTHPVNAVSFLDNDFLVNKIRAAAICEKLIYSGLNRKIKFIIQTRVDRLDLDILRLLKRAGCCVVEMGIEAASQKELDAMDKGTTVKLNTQAIRMCQQAGLAPHAYMLAGFKGETLKDLENRLQWLKKIGGNLTFSLGRLQIHPGTRLYQQWGAGFFANNPWTEETLKAYYQQDRLSNVPPARRKVWMERRYLPYERRQNYLARLYRNPPRLIARIVMEKIIRILDTAINSAFGLSVNCICYLIMPIKG